MKRHSVLGEEIPLQSRIILAADAFEAVTSDRPYRDAPGREFAIAELRRHAGTQFDPQVVQAFCGALESAEQSPIRAPNRVPTAPRPRRPGW